MTLPMPTRGPGAAAILLGAALIFLGILIATGALSWFDRLPGDVRIHRGGFAVYFPIISMLLISLVLSLLLMLARRLF